MYSTAIASITLAIGSLFVFLANNTIHISDQTTTSNSRTCSIIGTATMEMDGTIVLDLRCPVMGLVRYKTDDPDYSNVLNHIGSLQPGKQMPVPAFPDKKP